MVGIVPMLHGVECMVFGFFRRPTPAPKSSRMMRETPVGDGAFHAVDIVTSGVACNAVKHLAGTRFLSRERPPQLPLGNCDTPGSCACRYRHHEDRRKESRLHPDHAWGNAAPLSPERERRRAAGRRATDAR
jgi:hypothetical protein